MVVLDADSVMSGDCLLGLVRLMESTRRAGILQTATAGLRSRHACTPARSSSRAA